MTPHRPALLTFACGLLLRTAGLLLPERDRREWRAEWRAELHYVLGRCVSHRACLAFAVGAIPDAFCIRRHARVSRTASRCLKGLAGCAALVVSVALLLPAVRQQILPPRWQGPADLVAVSFTPSVLGSGTQVSAGQYLAWSTHLHPSLSRTAFYMPVSGTAELNGLAETWSVGRATENLPALLHISVRESLLQECRRAAVTPLVLSRSVWLRDFGGNTNVIGRPLRFAGRPATIVAVAPAMDSALPMQMDAWSLETDEGIAAIAAHRFTYGYMLAQRTPASSIADRGIARIDLISDDDTPAYLYVIPLSRFADYHRRMPELDFLLSLFMSCLMLPALLSISLRNGLVTERLSLRMRTRGWFFLFAKIALLLPLLYCGPLLIAYLLSGGSASAHTIQTFFTISAALLSAWWCLEDQRQRCPHCLCKLTSPARVGERSRSFLGFSGMEFVCAQGHGLLHVPDYPTSWFASQRWLSLDSSWRVLFQPGH
jgi:hypothetical protein